MLKHLTAPRLATIQAFFKAALEQDILGCYCWSQAVGAGLLPILGDVEVSLRNALHRALSQHFGNVDSFDWMMPQPKIDQYVARSTDRLNVHAKPSPAETPWSRSSSGLPLLAAPA
jgi:hypothetical protein